MFTIIIIQRKGKGDDMKKFFTWLTNAKHFHHRLMMNYLRKRGWVVFYLEDNTRDCKNMCWLKLYKEELLKV
jgi:hypothetical protein